MRTVLKPVENQVILSFRMVAFFRNDASSSNSSGRGVYGLVLGMLASSPNAILIIIVQRTCRTVALL